MPESESTFNAPKDPSPPSGLLEKAREAAREDNGYDSQAVRSVIEQEFQDIFDSNRPYDWQLDVTEALILGQDCIAIAGTGSGKTMPFGMPFMHPDYRNRTVLILSPLNELEVEQVRALPSHHHQYLCHSRRLSFLSPFLFFRSSQSYRSPRTSYSSSLFFSFPLFSLFHRHLGFGFHIRPFRHSIHWRLLIGYRNVGSTSKRGTTRSLSMISSV